MVFFFFFFSQMSLVSWFVFIRLVAACQRCPFRSECMFYYNIQCDNVSMGFPREQYSTLPSLRWIVGMIKKHIHNMKMACLFNALHQHENVNEKTLQQYRAHHRRHIFERLFISIFIFWMVNGEWWNACFSF